MQLGQKRLEHPESVQGMMVSAKTFTGCAGKHMGQARQDLSVYDIMPRSSPSRLE